jgi:peptidyl-tRNA hydrolase, PTH1 family
MRIDEAVPEKTRNGKALAANTTKPVVIAGLGNPGRKYSRHRHNLGFMVVDLIATETGAGWKAKPDKTLICETRMDRAETLLVKPQTYMNLSGQSVAPILKKLYVEPAGLIVVHDDLDLVPGNVRVKLGGGDGGHRGVRSIAECLGTKDFIRVRLGIGRPPSGFTPEEFVLSAFREEEMDAAADLARAGSAAVKLIVTMGLEEARKLIHRVKTEGCG